MDTFEITLPSSLFPFRLIDVPQFTYGPYRLDNVFRSINSQQRQACVELWLRNGAVASPTMAWERSRQVCYLMTENAGNRLVGVNTLYPDRLVADGPRFWFNRMFIEPQHRSSRLMIVGTAAMLCYARTQLSSEGIPGVLNVNENPKLGRRGMRRIFSRLGYRCQGEQNGQDVWYFEFSSIIIR